MEPSHSLRAEDELENSQAQIGTRERGGWDQGRGCGFVCVGGAGGRGGDRRAGADNGTEHALEIHSIPRITEHS